MKYSLKNLNKSIDKWIANKRNLAPDKDYAETFLKEQYTDLVNTFDGFKTFIKHQHFQTTYNKYRLGDYDYSEKMFANDDELITTYLDKKQRTELLKSKKIKLVISKEIKERTKNKKNRIIFIPVSGHYEIIDIAIKNDLFKTVKKAIIILEIKRKLDGTSEPFKLKNNNMVHLLSFPFNVKKEYKETRPIDKGSMSMDIISSEPNEVFKIAIRINHTYYIAIPKNETAKKDFRDWFDNNFRKDDFVGEDLELMEALIKDNNKFELVSEKTQAYKEFVGIRAYNAVTLGEETINPHSRPNKSFPMLKEWYVKCWELAKEAKQKNLDNSPEAITIFEIEFIKKNILDTERLYFPELLNVGTAEKPYTSEKGSNSAFRKWLNERKAELGKIKFDPSVQPKQDIEELTKEKLEYYGFDKESIERLFTWENYECALMNNRGYFWASNKENKIYSGKAGKEKQFSNSIPPQYHSQPKEKFKTFEELFRYAVSAGSITIPENNLGKQFNYKSEKSSHNFNFNVWLQNYKGWEYGNEPTYIENLTRENWVEYLTHCENEKIELEKKAQTIKKNWQPKTLPHQQTGTNTEQATIKGKPIFKPAAKEKNTYSHKEIAIAYCVIGTTITSENAGEILRKHSKLTSAGKLLQKRVNRASELSSLSENKTVDSKHLTSLENAKRLISGIKNKKALTDIDRIITAFKTAYNNHY